MNGRRARKLRKESRATAEDHVARNITNEQARMHAIRKGQTKVAAVARQLYKKAKRMWTASNRFERAKWRMKLTA